MRKVAGVVLFQPLVVDDRHAADSTTRIHAGTDERTRVKTEITEDMIGVVIAETGKKPVRLPWARIDHVLYESLEHIDGGQQTGKGK